MAANNTQNALYKCDASIISLTMSYTMLALVRLTQNFLVVLMVWKNKPMRNPTNLLLTNIAVFELVYLLTSTPSFILLLRYNKTITYVQTKHFARLAIISIITLAVLAVERYNALVHPMKIQRRLRGEQRSQFL